MTQIPRKILSQVFLSAPLLLMLSLAGCRYIPPSPAASQPSADSRAQSARASYPYDEPRPGQRRSRRSRADTQATPGTFDFYLLNLSWSPEFCATHTSTECGRGLGFVVHGLWPQDVTGDYPEDCSDAPGPANPQQYTDIIPTVALVQHEWQTHGTCSGLAADAYFTTIRKAFQAITIPANIGTGGDSSGVAPAQLLAAFAQANTAYPPASFALSCGNNRLTAVEICLSKTLQPEACQGVRSCRANGIGITPK